MKKQLFCLLLLLFLSFNIFAQTKEAQKVDEFGIRACEDALKTIDVLSQEFPQRSDIKIHLVFYEGKIKQQNGELLNPRRGEALNYAINIYLSLTKSKKIPKDKIVVTNGGFREQFVIEVWFVPNDALPPKLTPTLTKNDIKFRQGKPAKPFNLYKSCADFYSK